MEGLSTSIFLSLSVIYFMVAYVKSELSSEECLKLGFNRANLMCTSCDLLGKYELVPLRDNCYGCCRNFDGSIGGGSSSSDNQLNESDANTPKKYPKALLEVCG